MKQVSIFSFNTLFYYRSVLRLLNAFMIQLRLPCNWISLFHLNDKLQYIFSFGILQSYVIYTKLSRGVYSFAHLMNSIVVDWISEIHICTPQVCWCLYSFPSLIYVIHLGHLGGQSVYFYILYIEIYNISMVV